jgi:ArsR family transcriptional regulator
VPTIHLGRTARLFHALSDETRLGILEMLRDGEHCVCDLQAALDAGQSRLSFHLRVLKDAGLVTDRKEGRWSYYALLPAAFDEAHDAVRALSGASPAYGSGAPARPATRTLKVSGPCCG